MKFIVFKGNNGKLIEDILYAEGWTLAQAKDERGKLSSGLAFETGDLTCAGWLWFNCS